MLTRTLRTDSLFRCTAVFLLLAALGQAQGKDTTPDPKTLMERLEPDSDSLVSQSGSRRWPDRGHTILKKKLS